MSLETVDTLTLAQRRRACWGSVRRGAYREVVCTRAVSSTSLVFCAIRVEVKYIFFTLLSPQCCRRWFLGRTQRKTAWAWLPGVVLGFRVAASCPLSLKVALPCPSLIRPPPSPVLYTTPLFLSLVCLTKPQCWMLLPAVTSVSLVFSACLCVSGWYCLVTALDDYTGFSLVLVLNVFIHFSYLRELMYYLFLINFSPKTWTLTNIQLYEPFVFNRCV